MPKIIENVREQLLAVAKRQIEERGYARTTIRSVAGECGLGVGTVYNYFPSKDMLIATFMAEDWQESLSEIEAFPKEDPRALLACIYGALQSFSERHRALFCDSDAAKVFSSVFSERHKQLRSQLADLVLPLCARKENPAFLSQFVAEALLNWTMEGASFEEIYRVLIRLI